jgi:hypothetical protein
MDIPEMLPDRPVASTLKGLWIPAKSCTTQISRFRENFAALYGTWTILPTDAMQAISGLPCKWE